MHTLQKLKSCGLLQRICQYIYCLGGVTFSGRWWWSMAMEGGSAMRQRARVVVDDGRWGTVIGNPSRGAALDLAT
ncbi:hypothetical protein KFK09_013732 [Dendrobium nobile]|uniref:Uncharacterized protein n=1 Tax=Dendrobium nobile TaxID=94219 RepID=A0A8T3BB19_DENNO|nr:hypothetical protein KFK09_013732 [Dendrobium nobile]